MAVLAVLQLAAAVALPLVTAAIINGLVGAEWHKFDLSFWAMVVLLVAQAGLSFAHQYLSLLVEQDMAAGLRRRAFAAVSHAVLKSLAGFRSGDLLSRTVNDCTALKGALTSVLLQAAYDALSIVVVIVVLIRLQPALGLLVVASSPLSILVGTRFGPRIERTVLAVRHALAEAVSSFQSWTSHPELVRAHRIQCAAQCGFETANQTLRRDAVAAGSVAIRATVANAFALTVPSLIVFGFGGLRVLHGQLSIGILIAFVSYAAYFNSPAQRMIGVVTAGLPALFPIVRRVQQVLALETQCDYIEMLPRLSTQPGSPAAHLIVDGVRYERSESFTLLVPNLRATAGEIVGIVGPNGSGKTTFSRILLGLERPDAGVVRLYGATGRCSCALCPQEIALYPGTVRENLALFSRNYGEAELKAAIASCGLHEWVASLPRGLDSALTPGIQTQNVSPGQLRRIALCRAILQRPVLLVLDEPDAGLDAEGINMLRIGLTPPPGDRITLLFAHRPEVIALADRIYTISHQGAGGSWACTETPIASVARGSLL